MNPEIYGKYHKSKKYNEMLPDYFKPEHRLVEVCNKFRQIWTFPKKKLIFYTQF